MIPAGSFLAGRLMCRFNCGLFTSKRRLIALCAASMEPAADTAVVRFEPSPAGRDLTTSGNLWEAVMTNWNDTLVERPETDERAYVAGWTISGLAVLGTIVAVWLLGI